MSVFKKQTLVAQYPAYNVYRREAKQAGFIELTADDVLILKTNDKRNHLDTFNLGSVVSCALEYNECPVEALARAKAKNDKLVWISNRGAVLTAHHRDAENVVEVEVGMQIRFQGVIGTLIATDNRNLDIKVN